MKYRRLTKEQFESLNKEFSLFLASYSIDKTKWNEILNNKNTKVDFFLDKFSELVWEESLSKEIYLLHLSKQQLFLFYCRKKIIDLILIKTDQFSIDFKSNDGWKWMLNNIKEGDVELFRSKKKYNNSREIEIFDLIQKGASVDSGKLYKSIYSFLSNQP